MMHKIILCLTAVFALAFWLPAQAGSGRLALVIGNKDYLKSPLDNPINDAKDMKSALEQVGFRVIYRENADLSAMNEAVREFVHSLRKDSVGVVYYSGHGAQADGVNYLIPIGADITSKAELKSRAYDAGIILDEMKEADNRINVVILDACRNNPFKGFKGGAEGLATMSGPKGTMIAYATAPGSVAGDNTSGRNGTYTTYLKQYMVQPGLTIEEMFKKVRESVIQNNPDQIPWENSSIMGNFCFAGCGESLSPLPIAVEDKPQAENEPIKILQERLLQAEHVNAAQQPKEAANEEPKLAAAQKQKVAEEPEKKPPLHSALAPDARCESIIKAGEKIANTPTWQMVRIVTGKTITEYETRNINGQIYVLINGDWKKMDAAIAKENGNKYGFGAIILSQCKNEGSETIDSVDTTVMSYSSQMRTGEPYLSFNKMYIGKADGLIYARHFLNWVTNFWFG